MNKKWTQNQKCDSTKNNVVRVYHDHSRFAAYHCVPIYDLETNIYLIQRGSFVEAFRYP